MSTISHKYILYMNTINTSVMHTECISGGGRFIRICPYINVAPKLPNVNVQIDPFATLVPKCQYSDQSIRNIGSIFRSIHLQHWYPNYQMSIFRSIHLQHWYPNVNIRIGSIRNPFGWGRNPNIIHLPGAAIRTRNHNYEDRNYDLNAHPHIELDAWEHNSKLRPRACFIPKSFIPKKAKPLRGA